MILNFYLRKNWHKGEMRTVGKAKSRESPAVAHNTGCEEHIQTGLSGSDPNRSRRQVAEECGGHCMRKAATGHRLITAGIAGDTSSERFSAS